MKSHVARSAPEAVAPTVSAPTAAAVAPAVSNAAVQEQVAPQAASTTPTLDQMGWAGAGAEASLKMSSKPKGASPAGTAGTSRRRKKDTPLSANPEVTTADKNTLTYKDVGGKAFIQGADDKGKVEVEDVSQGGLGDCYLMAGMAAVAQADPKAIENAIKDNGDGTFDVTLYKKGKPVVVKVDGQFPTNASGGLAYAEFGDKDLEGTGEIWPALIEKAYAVLAQREGQPGYEEIEGGLPGDAVEAITGNAPTDYDPRSMSNKRILSVIDKALDNNTPVTCATISDEAVTEDLNKDFDKYGFYANHCYTFYSVDVEGETLMLRNPWGSSHPAELPVSVFKKCFDTLSVNKDA